LQYSCCFCFFFYVLRPNQAYFTYLETSPIAREDLQILAYARHLRPLSCEGSFTCRHILRHMTSGFTVSSKGQETNTCSQRDSNSRNWSTCRNMAYHNISSVYPELERKKLECKWLFCSFCLTLTKSFPLVFRRRRWWRQTCV